MTVRLHRGDLPADYVPGPAIAVDTETLGLNPLRDRLCVVQISKGDGHADVVQILRDGPRPERLAALMGDADVLKIFHFARFDLAVLFHALGVMPSPVYCTKIASKLTRTYTDRHGLKDILRELLGQEISKQQQSSDWGAETLTQAQLDYAASDVLHLHALKDQLDLRLAREGRTAVAQDCFAFLPTRAKLDLMGWPEVDIFAHS
ncbi:ribonuclease D [Salinarimonas ramus]|uniref:3'-5' exonuclease n=1 Tax=Salinarimonas ramus TaxID=690164 RepID=A0A917Q5J9_9HYPH|nr:ribonuclease D [Salinarimonas ramus]GGK26709.1 3'-5' exonuclease [Salinarimonas ramus]